MYYLSVLWCVDRARKVYYIPLVPLSVLTGLEKYAIPPKCPIVRKIYIIL